MKKFSMHASGSEYKKHVDGNDNAFLFKKNCFYLFIFNFWCAGSLLLSTKELVLLNHGVGEDS